jgi:3-phenylpropionate/cinnamic acid dioxygenase small subunit
MSQMQPGQVVPIGSPLYNRVVEFLYVEARLLDEIRLKEWGATLAEDLIYTAPLRETRPVSQMAASVVRTTQHYDDDWRSVMGRIMRLTGTKSAWAEDPPSRTRRLVTNIWVEQGDQPDEFRLADERFKLARREILLDQAVLGTPNLAIFL